MEIVVVFVDICPPESNLSAYQHYQSFWWNDLKKLTTLVKNLNIVKLVTLDILLVISIRSHYKTIHIPVTPFHISLPVSGSTWSNQERLLREEKIEQANLQ